MTDAWHWCVADHFDRWCFKFGRSKFFDYREPSVQQRIARGAVYPLETVIPQYAVPGVRAALTQDVEHALGCLWRDGLVTENPAMPHMQSEMRKARLYWTVTRQLQQLAIQFQQLPGHRREEEWLDLLFVSSLISVAPDLLLIASMINSPCLLDPRLFITSNP